MFVLVYHFHFTSEVLISAFKFLILISSTVIIYYFYTKHGQYNVSPGPE